MKGKEFIRLLGTLAIPLAFTSGASVAEAQYPTKSVTLVAPYGPGGASDLASRNLASVAPDYLGESVLVANRAGAGGVTGSTYIYNADPDGYNLLLGRVGTHTVSPAMKSNIPYEFDNFTYLGLIEINPVICATSTDKPYQTLEELKAAIQEDPGALSYSSAGVGTLLQLAPVMVMDEIGIENPIEAAIHVPFNSGGEAATAAVTGQVDFICTNSSALMSHIQGGELRPLIVTTPERLEEVPDAPTAAELGYPDLEVLVGWSGVLGPPDLPQEVVDTWTEVLQQVKEDEKWVSTTQKLGSVPRVLGPEEAKEFVTTQYETFSELVNRLDMRIE